MLISNAKDSENETEQEDEHDIEAEENAQIVGHLGNHCHKEGQLAGNPKEEECLEDRLEDNDDHYNLAGEGEVALLSQLKDHIHYAQHVECKVIVVPETVEVLAGT